MLELELSPSAQHWVNVVLIWVGFGTLAGLLARVILPVREPAGPVPTILLGIVGSMIGLLALSLVCGHGRMNPISPLGFLVAVAGAFLLLIGYRGLCVFLYRGKKDAGRSLNEPSEIGVCACHRQAGASCEACGRPAAPTS